MCVNIYVSIVISNSNTCICIYQLSDHGSSSAHSQAGSHGGQSGPLENVVEEENPPTFVDSTNNKAYV
jgi:hypothetical protein